MMINNPLEFKGQIIYFCDDVSNSRQKQSRVYVPVMPMFHQALEPQFISYLQ